MDKPKSWLDVEEVHLILDELNHKLEVVNDLISGPSFQHGKFSEGVRLAAELATYRCQVVALRSAVVSARDQLRALCRNEYAYGTINRVEEPPADEDGAPFVDPQKLPF